MKTIDTTYFKRERIEAQFAEFIPLTRFAEKLGVLPSTASRWVEPGKEVSGRTIGAVLNNFPISFDDAFITVREEAVSQRVAFRTVSTKRQVSTAA